MVDFAVLQQAVKLRLDEDRSIQMIEAEAFNLEEAVAEAATLLGVPIANLEYEVILKKSSFLGIGENICKIRAFENPKMKKERLEWENTLTMDTDEFGDLELIEDKDGGVFVQRRFDGLYMKVTAPIGTGKATSFKAAEAVLRSLNLPINDEALVKEIVKKATGEYVFFDEYKNSPEKDTTVSIEIADMEMRAYITVQPPQPGGCDFSYENYAGLLKQQSVVYGINEAFLQDFADKPVYHERICIATGKKPVDGLDSYLEYYFETEQAKIRIVEKADGQVDFRELSIIQNVLKDEKLAKKNDATLGIEGYTVTGKMLPAKNGKEYGIQLGKNVRVDTDGHTILADINGQVVFSNGKINVEMVYIVEGSVGLKTGNIMFLGNVIVTGNVEEGFSVKAAGNIEIHGAVERAALNAEGDIIVNQGITSKEGIKIRSGGNLWAKFIENATIDVSDSVIVTDGIVNSNIFAGKKIVCQGKRATIMGGILRAGLEINAKQIGNSSGSTETICEVGFDPQTKLNIQMFLAKKEVAQAEFDALQLDIQTLTNIQQQRGSLPEDKEAYLAELVEKRNVLAGEIKNIEAEIAELEEALLASQSHGMVSVTTKIFPGTVVNILDQTETIRTEYKSVSFVLEGNIIHAVKYLDTADSGKKKPQR